MNIQTNNFIYFGAMAGIFYGISKKHSFWGIAGYSVLFAAAGAGVGLAYQKLKN
jgi:hypothetical protein